MSFHPSKRLLQSSGDCNPCLCPYSAPLQSRFRGCRIFLHGKIPVTPLFRKGPHTTNPTPPPLVGTVTCSTQKFSLQLTVLLWQKHHPRVLPKAFQWKVVSMCKSSRSSGAGPRKFTPSWSRSRSPYIGSPLNISYAEFFRFMLQFLCLQMCVHGGSAVPQGGGGVSLGDRPPGVMGDRLRWGGEGQGGGGM